MNRHLLLDLERLLQAWSGCETTMSNSIINLNQPTYPTDIVMINEPFSREASVELNHILSSFASITKWSALLPPDTISNRNIMLYSPDTKAFSVDWATPTHPLIKDNFEILTSIFKHNDHRSTHLLISIYRSPSRNPNCQTILTEFKNFLNQTCDQALNKGVTNVVIAGDLNAWHTQTGCTRSNQLGEALYEAIESSGFTILNNGLPTRFPIGDQHGDPSGIDWSAIKCLGLFPHPNKHEYSWTVHCPDSLSTRSRSDQRRITLHPPIK